MTRDEIAEFPPKRYEVSDDWEEDYLPKENDYNNVISLLWSIFLIAIFTILSFLAGRLWEQNNAIDAGVAQRFQTPQGIVFRYIRGD